MMNWDYRVFHEDNGDYTIREVFYAEDGSIVGCTEHEVSPLGRSLAELTEDLQAFTDALTKPVLRLSDFPKDIARREERKTLSKTISHEQVLVELGLSESQAIV
ncbi:hypothetical protein [Roseofilum casamattae]|uniref:Uncharacterized protein n=1 Tax=Roseofilum casamattae BLCC-M143 TaxID=3022442 RepID=A0ABT7C1R3_9CYAN|nr:hypothetical protein [Roseofilum casamattae]MDJ1185403.1 hypothetical protein [Roseofilum casamattae BLCC-M143]